MCVVQPIGYLTKKTIINMGAVGCTSNKKSFINYMDFVSLWQM